MNAALWPLWPFHWEADVLHRHVAMVSEGLCPRAHGPLSVRPIGISADHTPDVCGWCSQCDRGYTTTARHRHGLTCIGGNYDDVEEWCDQPVGKPTVTIWREDWAVPTAERAGRPGRGVVA